MVLTPTALPNSFGVPPDLPVPYLFQARGLPRYGFCALETPQALSIPICLFASSSFRLPRYAQIPEVGLYLEQVVRYINARLAPLGEPELTGSMVSNYVKQKLVPAPQKKLYTAEHLARLLFIAVVKPVVPLEGLRLMFSIQEECYPLQTAYDYFCDEFENMLGAAFGVAPAVEGLGETESDAKDLLRSTISATVNKVCLDRYLEEYRKRREQAETIAEKEISLL